MVAAENLNQVFKQLTNFSETRFVILSQNTFIKSIIFFQLCEFKTFGVHTHMENAKAYHECPRG